jgi:starch phosphorylase
MPLNEGKRRLYYLSAEFLIGRLLTNNLIELGVYDDVKAQLAAAGHDLGAVEEREVEPSLGNGGLGRLAACFLDSIATLGLPATAWASTTTTASSTSALLTYQQAAEPDGWLDRQDWLVRTRRPTPWSLATSR